MDSSFVSSKTALNKQTKKIKMSLPYLEYEACVSVRIRKKDLPVFSKENCTVRLWDTSLDLYVRLMKCKHRHRHHLQHEKLMSLTVKRLFTDIKIYRCGSLMLFAFSGNLPLSLCQSSRQTTWTWGLWSSEFFPQNGPGPWWRVQDYTLCGD